jgi:hypothetical protein
VKQKIQETRADLVAERQKLIHSGKILKDDQTISELGLSESDFIVCMVSKETTKVTFTCLHKCISHPVLSFSE